MPGIEQHCFRSRLPEPACLVGVEARRHLQALPHTQATVHQLSDHIGALAAMQLSCRKAKILVAATDFVEPLVYEDSYEPNPAVRSCGAYLS
jgi:hypothetical protein